MSATRSRLSHYQADCPGWRCYQPIYVEGKASEHKGVLITDAHSQITLHQRPQLPHLPDGPLAQELPGGVSKWLVLS